MQKLRVLDLFSAAAGGWSLGMHRAGFQTMAACENVAWRRALYQENNPNVRIYDDVCTLTADRLFGDFGFLPDAIVGSPPCQDISSANTKGKGVEGERSGLYFEAIRIIGECRPRWFALENSANLRTRGADAVLSALEAIGYACWSFVVGAKYFLDSPHERDRSWLIGFDPEQIANPDGVGWHEGRERGWCGFDLSVQDDPCNTSGDGRAARRSRGCSVAATGLPIETCGDAPNADRNELREQSWRGGWTNGAGAPVAEHALGNAAAGNPSDANQAGQQAGLQESSLRQAEVADDGCGDGRRHDGQSVGQVGWGAGAGFDTPEPWSQWNSGITGHLRVDDGISAWVAQSRVAVGGPKGTAAASLLVEAFGDAVLPQIPEAIGRAIIRTERALSAVYGRSAA